MQTPPPPEQFPLAAQVIDEGRCKRALAFSTFMFLFSGVLLGVSLFEGGRWYLPVVHGALMAIHTLMLAYWSRMLAHVREGGPITLGLPQRTQAAQAGGVRVVLSVLEAGITVLGATAFFLSLFSLWALTFLITASHWWLALGLLFANGVLWGTYSHGNRWLRAEKQRLTQALAAAGGPIDTATATTSSAGAAASVPAVGPAPPAARPTPAGRWWTDNGTREEVQQAGRN